MTAFIDHVAECDTDAVEVFRRLWNGVVEWIDDDEYFRMGKQVYHVYQRDDSWVIDEVNE